MKNKFFSLILGLIVILAVSAATSCARTAVKNDASTVWTSSATFVNAEVSNAIYPETQVAHQCRDVAYVSVGDVTDPAVPVDTSNDTTYMIIGSILTVLLTLVSILFKTKADRATNVINEIAAALADRKVTTEEIKKIIAAWKGKLPG